MKTDKPLINPDKIRDNICFEYGISPDEFLSKYRYDPLPEARQLFCTVLASMGYRDKDISNITGFSPQRIYYEHIAAEKKINEIPAFLNKCLAIIKYLKK